MAREINDDGLALGKDFFKAFKGFFNINIVIVFWKDDDGRERDGFFAREISMENFAGSLEPDAAFHFIPLVGFKLNNVLFTVLRWLPVPSEPIDEFFLL